MKSHFMRTTNFPFTTQFSEFPPTYLQVLF